MPTQAALDAAAEVEQSTAAPSVGFIGLMLASLKCQKVTLYGFRQV